MDELKNYLQRLRIGNAVSFILSNGMAIRGDVKDLYKQGQETITLSGLYMTGTNLPVDGLWMKISINHIIGWGERIIEDKV